MPILSRGPKYRESKSYEWNASFQTIMTAVEDYARCYINKIDLLSDWVKSIGSFVKHRIHKFQRYLKNNVQSIHMDLIVIADPSHLHGNMLSFPLIKRQTISLFAPHQHFCFAVIEYVCAFHKIHNGNLFERTSSSHEALLKKNLTYKKPRSI